MRAPFERRDISPKGLSFRSDRCDFSLAAARAIESVRALLAASVSASTNLRQRDKADACRVERRLSTAEQAEFRQQAMDMTLDRLFADPELSSDLFIGLSLGEQAQDLGFALG